MNYALIRKTDIANGTGVRVSLFVSGCRHHCPGCFNREAWEFDYGTPYTDKTTQEILDLCDKEYIEGLSLLGGEPFEPENRAQLAELCKRFHEHFPTKSIWCYTGFLFDRELLSGVLPEPQTVMPLLREVDILVDGRFIESQKSLSLLFRGSANQRIIDVKASLAQGKAVLAQQFITQ